MTNKLILVRNVYRPGKPAEARTCPKNACGIFTDKPFSLFIIALRLWLQCVSAMPQKRILSVYAVFLEYVGYATELLRHSDLVKPHSTAMRMNVSE